ncbi:MAG: hypothetical protein IH830_07420 [Planctomycetes bacterium]|nr:hypothetical protein [Planctomycetota bacterium]
MIDGACGPAVCDNPRETLRQRFDCLPAASIVQKLRTEAGTFADYKHLAPFHYKSGQPGTVTTVYRLVYKAPTVVGRFRRRHDETTVVGVLLRSFPSLGCQLRDYATNDRYRGIGARATAAMLNREFRTISRVVIDPRWRGLGLAVQLVRHALEHPETIFTEALAAMGRVHPFFERAGMTRYDRPPRPEYARLVDAFDRLEVPPGLLACRRLVRDALDKHRRDDQRWIEMELRRWHRTAFRTPKHRLNALALDDLLVAARDRLMAQPVYYLYHHSDTEA